MGATIVQLPLRTGRTNGESCGAAVHLLERERQAWKAEAPEQSFHFWRGASGRSYIHTVYSLLDCPELPAANYMLARTESDGQRTPLRIARVANSTPSLNLAEIRRLGATLGANEVHVHFLATDVQESRAVAFDLRAGQLGALSAEPHSVRTAH